MKMKIAGMGMGGSGGMAPAQRRAAPAPKQKEQPLQVDEPDRQGPFYTTAGGIPVDKPFYRKKLSVKDYIAMRKDQRKNDPENYRLGGVIVPDDPPKKS